MPWPPAARQTCPAALRTPPLPAQAAGACQPQWAALPEDLLLRIFASIQTDLAGAPAVVETSAADLLPQPAPPARLAARSMAVLSSTCSRWRQVACLVPVAATLAPGGPHAAEELGWVLGRCAVEALVVLGGDPAGILGCLDPGLPNTILQQLPRRPWTATLRTLALRSSSSLPVGAAARALAGLTALEDLELCGAVTSPASLDCDCALLPRLPRLHSLSLHYFRLVNLAALPTTLRRLALACQSLSGELPAGLCLERLAVRCGAHLHVTSPLLSAAQHVALEAKFLHFCLTDCQVGAAE